MQIPLSDFEQYIDDVILSRGLNYFQSGKIIEFNEIHPGDIEAIVRGSEDYYVNLKIKNSIVIDYHCDCPFDYGKVCKHVAAVIFHIQQDELEFLLDDGKPKRTKTPAKTKTGATAKPKAVKKPKKKSLKDQIEELIRIIPHSDIINFVSEVASNNITFRDILLAKFADEYNIESPEVYMIRISELRNKIFSVRTWTRKEELMSFLDELTRYFEKAHTKREAEGVNSAFIIAFPILEQLVDIDKNYFHTMDENLIKAIEECNELLSETEDNKLDSKYKRQLYNLGLKSFKANSKYTIDRATFLLSFAIDNIQTENDYYKIVKEFEKFSPNTSNYSAIQLMTYKLTKAYSGEHDALKFLESKLSVYSLFKVYIDILVGEGKINEAIDRTNFYLKYNIPRDRNSKKISDTQQDTEIHEKLLELFRSINDVKMTVRISEYLMELTENINYTNIIKSVLSPTEWKTYYDKYISKRTETKFAYFSTIVAKLFIQEEQFDRLLEYLKKYASLKYLRNIDKTLFEKFPDETAALYYQKLKELLNSYDTYYDYTYISANIAHIVELGYKAQATLIINQLKSEFHKKQTFVKMLDSILQQ